MKVSIVAAMTADRVIGKDGKLPWHISEDLKRFKQLTLGHPVIMGRKTFESIGKPLPGRTNIVLSRDPRFTAEGTLVFSRLENALRHCENAGADEVFVIGGAELYAAALPLADAVYITEVKTNFEGDAYFPDVKLEARFEIVEREDHPTHAWVTYRKG